MILFTITWILFVWTVAIVLLLAGVAVALVGAIVALVPPWRDAGLGIIDVGRAIGEASGHLRILKRNRPQ